MTEGLFGDPVYPTAEPYPFAYHPPGYGYPWPPPPEPPRRSEPWVGWALVGAALLAVVGLCLPWQYTRDLDATGTREVDHTDYGAGGVLGNSILLLCVVVLAMGVVIGCRRGDWWTSVVALSGSVLAFCLAMLEYAAITTINVLFALGTRSGAGVWVCAAGLVASTALSVTALARRHPARPTVPTGPFPSTMSG